MITNHLSVADSVSEPRTEQLTNKRTNMNYSGFNPSPGGVSLAAIAAEFGTPTYVYDGNKIIEQYKKLKSAFPGDHVKIKYALKSLNNPNILKLLRKQGAGLDAVSIHEVQLGLDCGFEPHEILFTPNCVSFDEIKMGVEAGIQINIDSISMLEHFGHHYQNTVPCCIRINPHIVGGGN